MTHLIKERFFNQFCQRIRDMTEKLSSWKSVQHDDQQRALGGSAVASCQRTSKRWGPTRAQRLWCLNYPILAYHNQLTTLPHSRSRDNLRGANLHHRGQQPPQASILNFHGTFFRRSKVWHQPPSLQHSHFQQGPPSQMQLRCDGLIRDLHGHGLEWPWRRPSARPRAMPLNPPNSSKQQ